MVHAGYTTNSGHYYSYVKNSNGVWYCMDDSSVSQVSLSTVLSQKAYMLFYSKKEVIASPTISKAIQSFPTPPLSPVKNSSKMSSSSEKDCASINNKSTVIKSPKDGKSQDGVNIKEPKPIASLSPPRTGKVVKHLEKLVDAVDINATCKTWKVNHKAQVIKDELTASQKSSSDSKLLAPSLPDLMQHFSPVSGTFYFIDNQY